MFSTCSSVRMCVRACAPWRRHPPIALLSNSSLLLLFGITVLLILTAYMSTMGDSVAEWLACWTQAQKGPGSNRNRDAVG